MIPEEIPDAATVKGRQYNVVVRWLKRFINMRGGRGIRVQNIPGGVTISTEPQEVIGATTSGAQVILAQVWPYGPGQAPHTDHAQTGAAYWVREIAVTDDGTALQNHGESAFLIKQDGFWETAINLAEFSLPNHCRHNMVRSILDHRDSDTDEWPFLNADGTLKNKDGTTGATAQAGG